MRRTDCQLGNTVALHRVRGFKYGQTFVKLYKIPLSVQKLTGQERERERKVELANCRIFASLELTVNATTFARLSFLLFRSSRKLITRHKEPRRLASKAIMGVK